MASQTEGKRNGGREKEMDEDQNERARREAGQNEGGEGKKR